MLVTDMIGSTSTLVRAGADAADDQRHRHDALVANVVGVFGGHVVKSTGDGALAVLPSADHLVRAGSALREAAHAAGFPIRLGMSTGDATTEGGDLFGEPVVVASRLCDACPPGAVLVDATTVAVRGNRQDPAVVRHDLMVLRGFDEPREIWALGEQAPPVTPAAPPAEPAFGREDDVASIRDRLSAATGSTLVVLCGEPGIGKSHLARAVASLNGAPLWVRFSASERDGFVTWCAALDTALEQVPIGMLAALGPDVVSRAAGLLPSVAARLPPDRHSSGEDAAREPTLDALAAVVELVGRRGTIVLDDVQWAGPTSAAFIDRLMSSTSGVRLLATSRLPVPHGIADAAARVHRVGGLPDDAVSAMLLDRGVGADDVAVIARRAEGNPLLALFAAGRQPRPGGNPVADAFLALPVEQVEVLGIAALLGRDIDIVLLEQVTARPVAELSAHLEAAVGAGLLEGGERLSFTHDLVRESAESTLPAHRRAVLHAAAALAFKRRGDVLGAIEHVLQGFGALDADEAVEAVAAGCEALAERLAFEDMLAVASRLRTIVVADRRCRPRHEAAALLLQSWAYELLGDVPQHKDAALAAGRIARASGADMLLVEAALSRAGYGLAGVADPDSLELLDAALAVVADTDDARRARLTAMRAFYLVNYEGRGAEARAASAAAVALARSGDDDEALAEVLVQRSFVLMGWSDVVERVALADELRRLTPRLAPSRRREALASLHRNEGPLRLQLGDRKGFDDCHALVWTAADEMNSWLLRAIATMWDGLVALLDGRPGSVERAVDAMLDEAGRVEHNFASSAAGLLLGARRWLGLSSADRDEVADFAVRQPGLALGASLASTVLAIGADDRSRTALDELLARDDVVVGDSTWAAQLASVTEACLLHGREVPDSVVAALSPYSGQLLVTSWGVDVPGAADRFLAMIAAAGGDEARAADAFDRAAAIEANVSAVLPLRTRVWRHVLLGDVPMPDVPPELAGLTAEAEALRRARARYPS